MRFTQKIATGIAATTLAALTATSALAAPAVATGNVNVRTGPSTAYGKVDVLQRGERVEVTECNSGWCYVEHNGPDGWVSANYLSQISSGNQGGNRPDRGNGGQRPNRGNGEPDVNFSFGIGPDGPSFGFSFGNQNNRPNRPQRPTRQACFYEGANYTGRSFCMPAGSARASFGPIWNDRISSVQLFGGASVNMCQDFNYNGFCRNVSRNTPTLGPFLNDRTSSLNVR